MNKIYCFINSEDQWGNQYFKNVVALAEDGNVLAEHCSSNKSWAKHDIGINSDWHHEQYKEHFPDGYEMEFVEAKDVMSHKGLQEAFRLNQLQAEEVEKENK